MNTTKNFILKIYNLLVILALIVPHQSFSATMHGTITGNAPIKWNTAVPVPLLGGVAPSFWSSKSTTTTTEWYPGSLSSPEQEIVKFIDSESGLSFDTKLMWKGIEYKPATKGTGFQLNTYSDGNPGQGVAESCSISNVSLNLASISHDGTLCASNIGYLSVSGSSNTPFNFFRVALDLPDLVNDIQGKQSGRYTAVIYSRPTYFFKSQSGILTYLEELEAITIQVDFTAAFFTDARIVSGNGNIAPIYNKIDKSVSGSTLYRVQVDGLFPEGIKMTFDPNKEYELVSHDNPSVTIPYYVTCSSGCASSLSLIENGQFVTSRYPNGITSSDVKNTAEGSLFINFEVRFNQSGDQLISSSYSDQFSILFEPNL